MKFILLIEMPAQVTLTQRSHIKKILERISYERPKRNVFLIECKSEEEINSIKDCVIKDSHPESKVNYYQIVE